MLVRDYTCPGPWGFIARAAQRNFVLWGWGIPPRLRHLVSVDTTHCSSSRATRAYARDLALGSWVDSGFGRLVRVLMRVGVDENPPLTDVNGVLSPG